MTLYSPTFFYSSLFYPRNDQRKASWTQGRKNSEHQQSSVSRIEFRFTSNYFAGGLVRQMILDSIDAQKVLESLYGLAQVYDFIQDMPVVE